MSIKELATKLASEGKCVSRKHNSIFSAMEEYGSHSQIVLAAINGMGSQITANVELYRGSILPDARELAIRVKEATKATPVDPGAKVHIHVMEQPAILDSLTRSGDIDPLVSANRTDLPRSPLVVETVPNPDIWTVLHTDVLDMIKEAAFNLGYADVDKGINALVTSVFDNVSSNNMQLADLSDRSHLDHNELTILLGITMAYIKSDIIKTNMGKARANTEYLYKLRNILVTLLRAYSKRLTTQASRGTLIANVRTKGVGSNTVTTVYVVASVYQTYLEDNNIDNIIGAVYSHHLESFSMLVADVADSKYKDIYLERVRMESIKSALGNVNATRIAFPAVLAKLLSESTDESLDSRGIVRDDIGDIIKETTSMVGALSEHELMELTETSRAIMGAIVYQREDFFDFVSDMKTYHELYPKFTPEELATTATVAYVTRVLIEQLAVGKA